MSYLVPVTGEGGRVSEVLARLARVDDPELDESVLDLGFVTGVGVDDAGAVDIGFRLPTYWCAANFAFLMADDMRREVASLPWVCRIRLELGDHMYAETINRAMASGQSFQEAFAEEADGNLDAVRHIFALKAFQRRQLAVLNHLSGAGHDEAAILSLSIGGLRSVDLRPEGARLVARYLDRRSLVGPAGDADPAFVNERGDAVTPASFAAHRRDLRRVTVNVEFNGALCRGLLAARFGEALPEPAGEPTLLDFVRGRAGGRPIPA